MKYPNLPGAVAYHTYKVIYNPEVRIYRANLYAGGNFVRAIGPHRTLLGAIKDGEQWKSNLDYQDSVYKSMI